MPSGKREALLREFGDPVEDRRALLANARCLTEGVDVPTIDGVIFVDPRRSLIDIIQAVGRAIRKAPDKKRGTIVIPVFVEESADPEAVLRGSEFERVWVVLRALRAHDNQLAEQLDELQRRRGHRGRYEHRPQKIKLDLPRSIGPDFARAFDSRLIERTTAPWEFWYGLLQRYADREGHAAVPMVHMEDGLALGSWVGKQRADARAGKLDAERRRRLQAVAGWIWDHREAEWEEGFARLQQFVAREGHALVAHRHREGEHRLGQWVMVQRRTFARGQLDVDRIRRLDAIRGWSWKGNLEENWELGCRKLQAYAAREGDALVPKAHVEDGFPLGQWVLRQRLAERRGKLSNTRHERLQAISGWSWDALEASWWRAVELLCRYVEREGHARVPQKHKEDGFPLGEWVACRRRALRIGNLPPVQKHELDRIPGWDWTPGRRRSRPDKTWAEALGILLEYVSREGHARVPLRHVERRFSLGRWVVQQRTLYRRRQLSPERAGRLETIAGWSWDVLASEWEEGFERLRAYVARENTTLVPIGYRDGGYRLGQWVSVQRKAFKEGKLSLERQHRLEGLADWTWDTRDHGWAVGLAKLQQFAVREGHAQVPHITSKMASASACGSRTAAQNALDCRKSGKRHLSRYRSGRGTPRRRNGARATLSSGRTRIGKGTPGCPRAIRRTATAWGRGSAFNARRTDAASSAQIGGNDSNPCRPGRGAHRHDTSRSDRPVRGAPIRAPTAQAADPVVRDSLG